MPSASDVDIHARPAARRGARRSPSATTAGAAPSTEPAPPGRREALLVLSFGGPEGHDDVMPFLRERHPRPRHPARAARGRRRALPPLRRRQPDQRPEQGADRRARDRARRGRHRPAGLLGQPQLGALRRGHLAADGRRRRRARLRASRPRPTRRSPAAGSTTRTSPGPGSRAVGRADRGEAAALLRRPGLRAGQRRRARRRDRRRCPTERPRHRPAGRHRAQHPRRDGRRRRAATAAPTRPSCWRPPSASWPRPRRGARSTWCGRAAAGRRRCRGWSPTSTTTCGRWPTAGETAVVVFPVGFVSDHLEVIWDLDNEARRPPRARLAFARAATAGTTRVRRRSGLLAERRAGGSRLGTNCPAAAASCGHAARRPPISG